jgi:antitoxin (DNA-binding transcriptional repressor) of toxin-antitoxin stability system
LLYIDGMSATMTATEARAALPELLDRVQAGEELTITRHGRPVAVVVRPDTLRVRRAGAGSAVDAVRETLAAGRSTRLSESGAIEGARAEELVAEVRAGRRRR